MFENESYERIFIMAQTLFVRLHIHENNVWLENASPFGADLVRQICARPHQLQLLRNLSALPPDTCLYGTQYFSTQTGEFYHCFWELRPHIVQVCGTPCSPQEAERAFLPYHVRDFHDLMKEDTHSAVLLPNGDHYQLIQPNGDPGILLRCALRRKAVFLGNNFPTVCLHRSCAVCWYDAIWIHHRISYVRMILIPMKKGGTFHILVLCQQVTHDQFLAVTASAGSPQQPPLPLTARESQAVVLALQGYANRYISAVMHIKEGSVAKLLSGAYQKCHVSSRMELLRLVATV